MAGIPHPRWGRHLVRGGDRATSELARKHKGAAQTPRWPGSKSPATVPHPTPSLTPHSRLLAKSFTLTPEVQPEGRRLASSIIASIICEWFLVCYLHCSLGEKTSLPAQVLRFLLFIQAYTYNPIIKHRPCPESRVIACRCAQTSTCGHPKRPPARHFLHSGLMIEMAN